jgi:hypothetical protein
MSRTALPMKVGLYPAINPDFVVVGPAPGGSKTNRKGMFTCVHCEAPLEGWLSNYSARKLSCPNCRRAAKRNSPGFNVFTGTTLPFIYVSPQGIVKLADPADRSLDLLQEGKPAGEWVISKFRQAGLATPVDPVRDFDGSASDDMDYGFELTAAAVAAAEGPPELNPIYPVYMKIPSKWEAFYRYNDETGMSVLEAERALDLYMSTIYEALPGTSGITASKPWTENGESFIYIYFTGEVCYRKDKPAEAASASESTGREEAERLRLLAEAAINKREAEVREARRLVREQEAEAERIAHGWTHKRPGY